MQFAIHLKKGIYVFNKTQTNENKDDISKFEKWEELTSFQLIKWAANLQMNIAKKFQNWKKENEDDIKSNIEISIIFSICSFVIFILLQNSSNDSNGL